MESVLVVAGWRRWVVGLLVAIISVFAFGAVKINQNVDETRKVGNSNNRFLINFSDYMRCLIIGDEEAVKQIGEERYFNLCDDLLFRGTGRKHIITRVVIPPEWVTTTTSTTTTVPPKQ